MYGFHKGILTPTKDACRYVTNGNSVSDVFHTGSPESPLWEFKHGNGNFKRGDLVGLREIKRRASRHALVHRDSYSAPKPPLSQPSTPAEPMHGMQESTESRLTNLEHTLYDMHARLARSEDNSQFLHVRNQVVMEALSRSLQVSFYYLQEISTFISFGLTLFVAESRDVKGDAFYGTKSRYIFTSRWSVCVP